MKQKLVELQGEIDASTIIVGDFNNFNDRIINEDMRVEVNNWQNVLSTTDSTTQKTGAALFTNRSWRTLTDIPPNDGIHTPFKCPWNILIKSRDRKQLPQFKRTETSRMRSFTVLEFN